MLHKLLVVLIVIITLLSLVSVVALFGMTITGSSVRELDNSVTGLSFIIVELIIFLFIVLIIDLIRFKKKINF